jgi:hypothetical protein
VVCTTDIYVVRSDLREKRVLDTKEHSVWLNQMEL